MSIETLTQRILPPTFPVENNDPGGWSVVEQRLGVSLPEDYKDLIRWYGSGRFGEFIGICNPFSRSSGYNLFEHVERTTGMLRELRDHGETLPFGIFPEPGGLLPFAQTDNGDGIYWVTEGAPDAWTIAVIAARDPEWQQFKMSTSTFLAQVLSGNSTCTIFPEDFPPPDAGFEARRMAT